VGVAAVGDEQLANAPPSSLHSTLPLSAVNVKVAPVADVGFAGWPPVIATTGGDVRFDGDSLTGLAAERIVSRGIAHVPEGRHLFAGLTVRENLMAGAFAGRDGPGLGLVAQLAEQRGDGGSVIRPGIPNRQIHAGRLVTCWARP